MSVQQKFKTVQTIGVETGLGIDLDLGERPKAYPLITEGLYDVVFVSAHFMPIFTGKRLITKWKIIELGEFHGTELILGFQCPKSKKWGPLSKFAQCVRIAAGREPDRFDTGRLSTSIFRKNIFCAEVITVTRFNDPISRKLKDRPFSDHYSVIKTLVAVK
jgi:hypothetical protein